MDAKHSFKCNCWFPPFSFPPFLKTSVNCKCNADWLDISPRDSEEKSSGLQLVFSIVGNKGEQQVGQNKFCCLPYIKQITAVLDLCCTATPPIWYCWQWYCSISVQVTQGSNRRLAGWLDISFASGLAFHSEKLVLITATQPLPYTWPISLTSATSFAIIQLTQYLISHSSCLLAPSILLCCAWMGPAAVTWLWVQPSLDTSITNGMNNCSYQPYCPGPTW